MGSLGSNTDKVNYIELKIYQIIITDSFIFSEGIFACANIFSALKMVYIFTINPHLGPLIISLGRMIFDIMK